MLKEITPEELRKKLSKVQLIDIREPYEVEDGNIEGSINNFFITLSYTIRYEKYFASPNYFVEVFKKFL